MAVSVQIFFSEVFSRRSIAQFPAHHIGKSSTQTECGHVGVADGTPVTIYKHLDYPIGWIVVGFGETNGLENCKAKKIIIITKYCNYTISDLN